jgi:hypothetical protein
MSRWVITATAFFTCAFPAAASLLCPALPLQDSASSLGSSQSPVQESQAAAPSPPEPKKTKKVWTNENLGEVNRSPVSQVGDAKDNSSGKGPVAKPASLTEVASFRKQLAALQAQLAGVEKQIADLKSFSKGESPGANGMQLYKRYSMEPIDGQVRKLEGQKKLLAAQMEAVFDAARKRGIEPGQLR